MNVTLPPALDALVARKLASGLYENAAEVVREALRQMDARESALAGLKREVALGFDQLDRGELVEMDREAFFQHIRSQRRPA
ncbi:type II toxin-antitoxin system ParD family antitoxin [Prosthecobacter dejongeii]|uniref:Antitoxin ParD1/3/4 n=1 Tax=Prosthecobacter dejongeii TaxID=48465 RepID=A0A7W7YGZ5_9BACT|nr:type II toxin-antitoxin system ParD family antitoxin [Prosthecobacter dejongeii]MBB5036041.1 antitoxin ParD1/3/4 [Prosthecobacter dejongeii]